MPSEDLPFGGSYRPVTDLGPVVSPFLADDGPGVIALTDSEEPDEEEPAPFPVRVSAVGT